MAGKKKGKKEKSQDGGEQPSSSQQQGSSGDRGPQQQQHETRGRQQSDPETPQQQQSGPQAPQQQPRGPQGPQQQPRGPQGPQQQPREPQDPQQQRRGPQGPQQQQREPRGPQQRGPQGPPQQQHQRGPQEHQQPRGPQGPQQHGGPWEQQQRGPPEQQQQRGPPEQQQQRGPKRQQQRGPPKQQQQRGHPEQQQQRGPPEQQQQRGTPEQQQQRGPPEQQQRGPKRQQQRGPPEQQQQRGPPEQQQQRGPPGQQQWGPPGQQQWGPPGQQQWGPPGQQQWGPPGQQQWGPPGQQQWGPPGQQQGGPPGQQQPGGQQLQQSPQTQKSRGRGRPQQSAQVGSPSHPQHIGQPQVYQQPQQATTSKQPQQASSRAPLTEGAVSQQSLTSQFSGMQISKTEGGQGDGQRSFSPIESKVRVTSGTKGRRILVETNHLSLNLGKLTSAVHYDVNLVPDLPKKLLRNVLEAFRLKHYKNRFPAFDGRKNLYSSSALPFGDFIADEIIIQDSEGREKKFKVEIKFANNVDLTPLRDLLQSRATPREALQVVDIVLRSAPASTCISVGRSFFVKPATIIDLGEGMEMYNGFFQSAIRGWKPFLNVDVAHKSFPKNINLLEVIIELFDSNYQPFRREDLNRPLIRYQLDALNSFIKTLKVVYEIPNHPGTRRVHRVNGIDDAPKDKMFRLENGEQLSIERYFEKNKNYKLRYPHLPTLWVGAQQREQRILLPLELCTLEEGQVLNRKMTENQTSKMIRHAATSTSVRKDKIMRSLNQARHNDHPSVREFGFSVGNAFEKLEARVLTPPSLAYFNNKPVHPGRGVWRGDRFFAGVTINKWTIACVERRPPRPNDLSNFAEMIFRNATSSGMNITAQAEKPFTHVGDRQHDIKKYFQTQKEKKYDVIFVVVPNSGQQYSFVKTAAEINVGCLTQCIKSRTLGRMNPQTAINILLKVNSKLNGTNHCLLQRPPIMNNPCMIMGADVTHPSPDSRDIPSVAAVTASHDPKAFKYNICWRLQPPKVEIIEDLEAIVIEQLKYFYLKTKVKPERIVFFRDGVSEGQFDQVRHAEIRAIRAACKKLQQDGYEPSITFLVVQKRHHTRLFPTNPKDSEDKNNNVPAGTCVDTTITHPFLQDFYLVSHASIQGVAKPTKYCTLWDDNSMSNDDIEELTYHLCHMFTRCNRSVSYPAPTYYAHLAAARAKVYIENERLNMDNLQRECDRFRILDVIRKDLPMFFV